MSEEPEGLVLVFLRRLDAKIDRLTDDVADVKHRLTAVEIALGSLAATEASHYANSSLRSDKFDERLDRIERRLDIREA